MADWTAISGYTPQDYTDTAIFEVDADTKKIALITGQPLVAGEENTQYMRFSLDRYWDGIDIKDKDFYVEYALAGTYYGKTAAVNAEYNTEQVRFGWIVPKEACCISGTLFFVLRIESTDYVLKTQIAEHPVFKSVNVEDVVPEPTKEAWYREFEARVETAISDAEAALTAAQAAQTAAEAAAQTAQTAEDNAEAAAATAQTRYGSPLVAQTADEMVEQNRVYVYTGSETGYIAGHWYYYNSTAWTDGGVYNGTGINTDTTLTQSGMAADAKAVGDELSTIKEDLSDIGIADIEGDGNTDVTAAILSVLTDSGVCTLGEGTYVIDGLVMPDGTTLQGMGNATKLIHKPLVSGSAIKMGSRCTIKNLTLYGEAADINIPTSSEGGTEGTVNYIGQRTDGDGYVKYLLTEALPAGTYHINVTVTSDSGETGVYLRAVSSENYSSANIIMTQYVVKDTPTTITVDSSTEIRSIWLFAKSSASASQGFTVTVSSISMVTYQSGLIGNRHGIEWSGSDVEFGIVDNCRIERFTGSAILAMDTDTPIDNNLAVSNCFIRNCIVGVYIRKDSEFAKITNCTIVRGYYGILCRGGNNNISNCGIDGNVIGVQLDADEGHNGGHGVISGCSINHSGGDTGYGLIIKDSGREMVSGCNIMLSKVRLENSNGNVINGCGFKDTVWEIIGGGCSVFANCMVNTDGITITVENNTRYKIVNCFTRGGEVVTAT